MICKYIPERTLFVKENPSLGVAVLRHSERGLAESKNLLKTVDNYCIILGILRLGHASLRTTVCQAR